MFSKYIIRCKMLVNCLGSPLGETVILGSIDNFRILFTESRCMEQLIEESIEFLVKLWRWCWIPKKIIEEVDD